MSGGDPSDRAFERHLSRLRRKAPATTRLLIDLVAAEVIPLLTRAGFSPSPEATKGALNEFGLIWGINDLAFQDRSEESWPTIVLKIDRALDPNFVVELCEIPEVPVMLDRTHLAREEANVGHCTRALRLRKGLGGSYRDQQFGATFWSVAKARLVRNDIVVCVSLLTRVVTKHRASFLRSVERALDPKTLYLMWDESDPHRPNRSMSPDRRGR